MRYCLLACLLLPCLAGCNSEPPLGKVEGRVTLHGQPMATGSITMSDPVKGATYVSLLDQEGRFRFEVACGYGLPPGEYKVAISPHTPPQPSMKFVAPDTSAKVLPDVPEQYQNEATSGLTATVQSGGKQEFRFDLP